MNLSASAGIELALWLCWILSREGLMLLCKGGLENSLFDTAAHDVTFPKPVSFITPYTS